jgi:hypothetical protein
MRNWDQQLRPNQLGPGLEGAVGRIRVMVLIPRAEGQPVVIGEEVPAIYIIMLKCAHRTRIVTPNIQIDFQPIRLVIKFVCF